MAWGDSDQLNRDLKRHLKGIVERHITLNDEEAKANVAVMESTVNALLEAMKQQDPLFKILFQKTVYTGSYYDGLRITAPTEFDLDMVLRLPIPPAEITMEQTNAHDYKYYKIRRPLEHIFGPQHWEYLKNMSGFFDNALYLLRNGVQKWIQGIISTVTNSGTLVVVPREVKNVTVSLTGPAFTLHIYLNNGRQRQIDVDLVPAIDGSNFPFPSVWPGRFAGLPAEAKVFYLIPKPFEAPAAVSSDNPRHWRVSFPEAEKKLLYSGDLGCVKILIKLLKFLRDTENWQGIASYYIKTMFLYEIDQHPPNNVGIQYWKEDNLGIRFLDMLRKFRDIIHRRNLPYYFGRQTNLLSGLNQATADNIEKRLDRIISSIERDPSQVIEYMP